MFYVAAFFNMASFIEMAVNQIAMDNLYKTYLPKDALSNVYWPWKVPGWLDMNAIKRTAVIA
jgi:hypothetical protein